MAPPVVSSDSADRRDRLALAAAAIIMGLVFAFDLAIPLGNGLGSLYAVPLLIVSFVGPFRWTLYGAWLASLLLIVRVLEVPISSLAVLVIMNRIVALSVVWTAALMIVRLQQAVHDSREKARALADVKYALDQSAIVATTDTRGTITYANDKFCEISRYSREELLGQDHRIINSGFHPKEFIRDLWTTIANGRVWRGEIRNRAKDGTIYWVDTTIVPFLDSRDRPYQYMAIRYDITARKKTEEQVREQAALTRLGEMAAVVAHEVKNPIAGIRGALQVILSRMPGDQRDRAIVAEIIDRLDGLSAIVRDLLLYARPAPPRQELVDVRSILDATAALLKRDPALGEVAVEVDGATPPIAGDAEQLRVVFQNLIINAAQAMGGRGAIDVTIATEASRCRIAIHDQGPGMPPDVLTRAFEPFFTTKHRGTGLGLAIARRIVEAHQGHLHIASEAGQGTTVTLDLPVSPRAAA
jgi:two-component system CheB/CheR fusion protein